jgi:phosphate transport system protein
VTTAVIDVDRAVRANKGRLPSDGWVRCFWAGQRYSEGVRTTFHQQLAALATQLGEVCGRAGAAMEHATRALLRADVVLAEQVMTDYERIAAMSAHAADDAFVLLALQQPVAGDLRAIVSAIQIAADVDRMGALAMHVAKIVRRRHPEHALPEQVTGYFAEMGRIAVELSTAAQEVLTSHDPDKAGQIDVDDDAMDELHRRLFSVLLDQQWKHGVAAAVDVTLLGRFYERFADHAVEVARRVIFQATGKFPSEEHLRTPR